MIVLYFATLFDSNYLSKGLALHASMREHIREFKLFVLCLDDITFKYFDAGRYHEIHPLRLEDLESVDEELLKAKANRGRVEYYFTLSPVLPLHILKYFQEVDFITTLDADIFFFNDPQPIYDAFKGSSILITPHRFPAKIKEKEVYGLYNVSFQVFKNDTNGLRCLEWWREKCLEWCYDKFENNRYADQKYLDQFADRFAGVMVLEHEGAGLAPWNVDNYFITKVDGRIYSNDEPLIFYHFHYLKPIAKRWFTHGVDLYLNNMNSSLRNFVYHPYINQLIKLSKELNLAKTNNYLRLNSAPKHTNATEVLKRTATLYNMFSLFTVGIDLKKYFDRAQRGPH